MNSKTKIKKKENNQNHESKIDENACLNPDILRHDVYVTVIVKLKNHKEPYTYTRTYIPEIKLLSLSNAKTAVDKLAQYMLKPLWKM